MYNVDGNRRIVTCITYCIHYSVPPYATTNMMDVYNTCVYLKVTIIYGDNTLRIGGIAHFARIKFRAYAACVIIPCARSRASASMVRAQENRIVYTRCAYHLRTSTL